MSACDKKDAPQTPATTTPASKAAAANADATAPDSAKVEGKVDDKAAAPPQAQDAKDTQAAQGQSGLKPAAKGRPAIKKVSKQEATKIAADQRSASQWLHDGRKAVQAKNYDEGIALYTKAMKVRPSDPTLLAELGWAHYLKGNRDMARAFTLQGMHVEREPKKQAAMLYNLGRIAEDEGKASDAIVYYMRSLAMRPNKVVQGRYDALQGGGAKPIEASLDAMCVKAMEQWECSTDGKPPAGADPDAEFGQCTCTIQQQLATTGSLGPFKAAAILNVKGSAGAVGGSIDGAEHLAVQTTSGGWQIVSIITNNYTPGVSYISNSGTIESIAFQTLGDQEILVLRYKDNHSDGNYPDNELEFSERSMLMICSREGQGAQCVEVPTAGAHGVEQMLDGEDDLPQVTPTREEWVSTATILPTGKLRYAITSGQAPDMANKLAGERSFSELATLAKEGYLSVVPLR